MTIPLTPVASNGVRYIRPYAYRPPGDPDFLREFILRERENKGVGLDSAAVLSALEPANSLDTLVSEFLQNVLVLNVTEIGYSDNSSQKSFGWVGEDGDRDRPNSVLCLDRQAIRVQ